MPIAHYRYFDGSVEVKNRNIRTPKNIVDPDAWVTQVRKVIPEVPNTRTTDWFVLRFDASLDIILIELVNSVGETAKIAINRQAAKKSAVG